MDYDKGYSQATFLVKRIRDAAAAGKSASVKSGLAARMEANEKKLSGFDEIRANYMSNIQDMFSPIREDMLKAAEEQIKPETTQEPQRFAGMGQYAAYEGEAADRIKKKLIDRGMPEHIAEGFVMNFMDESGLSSTVNEKNPQVKGSRGGFGLYQLTGPRRKAYEEYAKMQGIDVTNPMEQEDAQLSFLMEELNGPESGAWDTIQTATDAGTAAAYIARDFLRPAESFLNARVSKYTGRSTPYITKPKSKI